MRVTSALAIVAAGIALWPPALGAQDAAVPVPARLSLSDALRLVEQRDPGLAAARDRLAVASAAETAARQRPNPVLGFSSEGYGPWNAAGSSLDRQETVITLSQEFETAGRRRLRGAVASAGVAGTRAEAQEQRRRLRLDAARAYFQLALARSEVETATASLAEVDKVITVNRARYKQGEVSGGELRRLEVERMKFSDDLLAAELAEKNERAALLALLGAPRLDAPLEPTDGLALAAPASRGAEPALPAQAAAAAGLPGQAADLVARALATRPDLAAARQEQARADADLKLQQALRTPTVSVGAGYRRDFGENGLVVSASLPLPIFDRNAGGVARAEAERRVAANQAREVERAVSLDVQQAVNTVSAARERLAALESDYLQKAKEARDTALSAYRSGASDLIDYLDAQRAYRDVQRAYQRALFDHRVSLLQLDAAIGVAPGELEP